MQNKKMMTPIADENNQLLSIFVAGLQTAREKKTS